MRQRQRFVDLLKIIAMAMVVALHITTHGVRNAEIPAFGSVWWIVNVLNTFSIVAVDCFVLISGYYLCVGRPQVKKILLLWLQVVTYSMGVYLAMCGLGEAEFSVKELIRYALPLLTNQYWFFKCYVLLVLLSPILNHLIGTMERRQYEKMLLTLLVLFSAIPSVNIFGDTFGADGGYSLIWFGVLYLIAGYLRKWPPGRGAYGRYYVLICLVICAVRVAGAAWGGVFGTLSELQRQYNSPLVVLAAVCLFLWALNRPASCGKRMDNIIGSVAGLAFGVYLLHDHGAVSDILWNEWIALWEVSDSGVLFTVRALLALIGIFTCGVAAEWLRAKLMKAVSKIIGFAKVRR